LRQFKRHAVYYAPEPGAFADAAAAWLGWDPVAGQSVAQPNLPVDLSKLTEEPRKYGFHGTIKAPFRPAADPTTLSQALEDLARTLTPVRMPGLQLVFIDRFLALTPLGDLTPLLALAATVVQSLDPLRAPLTAAEIARRHPDRLTDRQRVLLDLYGYPYVMEQFQFHLTLSGPLTTADQNALLPLARQHFTPCLPAPFVLRDLCLFGEAEDGRFHLLKRCKLGA
jgi:hypothetical protein